MAKQIIRQIIIGNLTTLYINFVKVQIINQINDG